MAPLRSFLFYFSFLSLFASHASARDVAWNEHTLPEHAKEPRLTYYPEASRKVYHSDSPLIEYKGKWITMWSKQYTSGSLHMTHERGAALSFSFSGTGIVWLGNCDKFHGYAQVFLDGEEAEVINLFCDASVALRQQKLFKRSNLENGPHTLRIVNLGWLSSQPQQYGRGVMDLDAFVVTSEDYRDTSLAYLPLGALRILSGDATRDSRYLQLRQNQASGWKLTQRGSSGVAAMQLAIVSPTLAIIIDKAEHNPLTVDGHPAWASLYNLNTQAVRPLRPVSNSFCAGGAFLSNGTLVNVGGNPVVQSGFNDVDGSQGIRLFNPCNSEDGEGCEIYENPQAIRMASPRWYPTAVRIQDGSIMIIGGSRSGGFINNPNMNNPTLEYFPSKSIHGSGGSPIHLQFLEDTLKSNLFPIAFLLPSGNVFVAANNDAMVYDWKRNVEERLRAIPNGVRVTYPMTGTGLLLPLSYEDNYTPEILICGGTTLNDQKASEEYSSQDPASAQCSRMVLTEQGIARGWQVEAMPEARLMPDAVLLPTGQILIVNGAGSGVAGYGNVRDQVGQSNADNPVFTPVMYDPQAPEGRRFYRDDSMPTSSIPRLYHSTATLTPKGNVLIMGSNPNFDKSDVKYVTEYRVESLDPPYMFMERPVIRTSPRVVEFGEAFEVRWSGRAGREVKVALMDLGFVTHSVHANSRLVWLRHEAEGDVTRRRVTAPPDGQVYPPGPGWLFIVVDGVPSEGVQIMVGGGKDPAMD